MQSEKITIYDIAREANVSAATVSRVLSGHPHVSSKTQEKVMRVVEKYQFTPNSLARGLYQRSTRMLGIILPGFENPYYASVYTAAHDEARVHGYAMLMFRSNPNEAISADFIDQLIERRLDGVLLLGGMVESPQRRSDLVSVLSRLQQYMPLVTICPPIQGLDCINFHSDLSSSVRQSVRHLHALGHKRIAFLGGSTESRSAGERELGFIDEMTKLGLTAAAYRHETGHTAEAGELGALKLLSTLERNQWPTAIIAINDLVALGAMRQIKRMQIKIPEDMAIIGCDNQFFSPFTDPPLTTVDNHPAELGRIAIQQLLATIENENRVFSQVRDSTLVIRESCGAYLGRRKLA